MWHKLNARRKDDWVGKTRLLTWKLIINTQVNDTILRTQMFLYVRLQSAVIFDKKDGEVRKC